MGYDEGKKDVIGTKFSDCGLRDSSELPNLIIRRCSNLFDLNYYEFEYEREIIGIIHLPPNINKPVFIKNYRTFSKDGKIKSEIQQRVFVRKNSATHVASRYDFDMMYYDRKNLQPDYDYSLDLLKIIHKEGNPDMKNYNSSYKLENDTTLLFVLDNVGRRNLIIKEIQIELLSDLKKVKYHEVSINHDGRTIRPEVGKTVTFKVNEASEFYIKAYDNKSDKIIKIGEYELLEVIIILSNNKKLYHSYEITNLVVKTS